MSKLTDHARQNQLPAPVVASLLPDNAEWTELGLLPSDKLTVPLSVEVPEWPHNPVAGQPTLLILYWDTVQVGFSVWQNTDFPLSTGQRTYTVLTTLLNHGIHVLRYVLTPPNGDESNSIDQTVTIDLLPPFFSGTSNQGRLIFDTDTVTEAYLQAHGDVLTATGPVYLGGAPGDVITWLWSENPADGYDGAVAGLKTLFTADVGQPLSVEFSGDFIRDQGDGPRFAYYQISDRAGNSSPFSLPLGLGVQAQPVQRYLPAPTVVGASGSATASTLQADRATSGAQVRIPAGAVFKPDDIVSVQWAAPGSLGAYLSTVADASGLFPVPNTHIATHMGHTIALYYQVEGNDPAESQRHALTVATATGWRTIQLTQPPGSSGNLSLGSIQDTATFWLPRWTYMAAGQIVTITLNGIQVSGSGLKTVILSQYPVVEVDLQAGGVAVNVVKSVIAAYRLNTSLRVEPVVSFDEGASFMTFPILTLNLIV